MEWNLQGRVKPDAQGISKLQEAVASWMLSPLPTDIEVQLAAASLPASLTLWGAPGIELSGMEREWVIFPDGSATTVYNTAH